jgi:hypothetical protein
MTITAVGHRNATFPSRQALTSWNTPPDGLRQYAAELSLDHIVLDVMRLGVTRSAQLTLLWHSSAWDVLMRKRLLSKIGGQLSYVEEVAFGSSSGARGGGLLVIVDPFAKPLPQPPPVHLHVVFHG